MDIIMPKMNGIEATRRIMETNPVPIVVVTASCNSDNVEMTFKAMEAGAITVLEKPKGKGHPDHILMAEKLISTVKLMSEVKVVRRKRLLPQNKREAAEQVYRNSTIKQISTDIRIVAIGASTGGPVTLQTILSKLPKDFAVPVLIVQHIATGFIHGLADWLNQSSDIHVQLATHEERVLPGHVYFAPDGFQMKINEAGMILLTKDVHENGLRPSASSLFRSVANAYGQNAIGVLLTGMGQDGAKELRLMREKGAITIAQDKESSVIHGMPGEAIKLDAARYTLPDNKIAKTLELLVNKHELYKA